MHKTASHAKHSRGLGLGCFVSDFVQDLELAFVISVQHLFARRTARALRVDVSKKGTLQGDGDIRVRSTVHTRAVGRSPRVVAWLRYWVMTAELQCVACVLRARSVASAPPRLVAACVSS